jgi:DNA-binding transcriptional MerR regulator
VARRCGTTPRTIRYYEELGLLRGAGATERPSGGHRSYTEADVADLCELIRLRELLGLSLEELGRVIEAEEARALLRAEFEAGVRIRCACARSCSRRSATSTFSSRSCTAARASSPCLSRSCRSAATRSSAGSRSHTTASAWADRAASELHLTTTGAGSMWLTATIIFG